MIKFSVGPPLESNEGLVLIQVSRSRGNKLTKESIWAKSLGADLYEIKGPLHLIAGLNSNDVVKAVILPNDSVPSVSHVVKRSGFKTLHVIFFEVVPKLDQENLLGLIKQWNAEWEAPFDRFYTVEVNPNGNYQAVRDYFETLRLQGLVMYEPEVNIDVLLRSRFSV